MSEPFEPEDASLEFRGESAFHPNALKELQMKSEEMNNRLERRSIELSQQDGADNVSSSHVRSAFRSLVPSSPSETKKQAFNNVMVGVCATSFVAFLIAIGQSDAQPSPLYLVCLLLSAVGTWYFTFEFAKTIR